MSETVSAEATLTAPSLVGVWVFDPLDPDGTERNYMHAESRVETVRPKAEVIDVHGREDALVEFGATTVRGVSTTVTVPFGDEHDAGVQWWRDAATARRTINYRDNRGRLFWVALPGGVEPRDVRAGTEIFLDLRKVFFDESVT